MNNLPITIRIGYPWSSVEKSSQDPRWIFLRNCFSKVVQEVSKRAKVAENGRKLSVVLARMRCLHGSFVIASLTTRCHETDILGFDITGNNPNVMLELGVAIGSKGLNSGRIFIFQETPENSAVEPKVPSDLVGYFITRYTRTKENKTYKLADVPGFRAALRSRLMDLARERGMWVDRPLEIEDDDKAEGSPSKPKKGVGLSQTI
jgi:hypothetical protein